MAELYYTAITHDETNEIRYAEHFDDIVECEKRSRQLEAEARHLGFWKCYKGTEPVEAYLARINAKPLESEVPDEGDAKGAIESKFKAYTDRINAIAAKAGAKTISILTAPEIDDRDEARPLPNYALAEHEYESAKRVVDDFTEIVQKYQARADSLDEQATGTKSDQAPMNPALKVAADGARGELDQAKAKLYHAEKKLADKAAALEALKPKSKEGKKNA